MPSGIDCARWSARSSIPGSSRLRNPSSCRRQVRNCRVLKPAALPRSASPTSVRVDCVQPHQRVDQVEHQAVQAIRTQREHIRQTSIGQARTELHQVERGAEHRGVGAQQLGGRHRHSRATQRRDDPILPAHVVRRGLHVGQRRPAQHPGSTAVGDGVGEIRPAAGQQPGGQRAVEQIRAVPGEVVGQPLDIQTGIATAGRDGRHSRSAISSDCCSRFIPASQRSGSSARRRA